ncbi:MAG: iron-containing alcohol dehydrogenase [Phycisphaerae bacterium]
MAKFIVPEKIITDPGSLSQLPGIVQSMGISRVMLVTGRSWARESGYLGKIIHNLGSVGVVAKVFEGVPEEPSCCVIDQIRESIKANDSQLVIGLGGGSAMDAAKAGAILVYSDKSTVWHLYSQQLPNKSLPTFAIPTTAGTGSEATPVSVLTDEEKKVKMSIRTDAMMPRAAIVDPELTITCSPGLTAITGMDALVQAIESFCSRYSTHLSDAITEKAISLISKNIVEAYRDGTNMNARQAMSEGSLMAGMALANVRLGAVHGLAHPLGGKYGIPHGLVCAVLMPVILEFNKPELYSGKEDKYSLLCNILMADPVIYVRNLLTQLDLPQNLHEYKIKEEDLDVLADQSMTSGSTKANPREVTKDDFLEMLRKVM